MVQDDGVKKVRMGTTVAAEKIRRDEHESAGQMREAHERTQAVARVDTNTQAGSSQLLLMLHSTAHWTLTNLFINWGCTVHNT